MRIAQFPFRTLFEMLSDCSVRGVESEDRLGLYTNTFSFSNRFQTLMLSAMLLPCQQIWQDAFEKAWNHRIVAFQVLPVAIRSKIAELKVSRYRDLNAMTELRFLLLYFSFSVSYVREHLFSNSVTFSYAVEKFNFRM